MSKPEPEATVSVNNDAAMIGDDQPDAEITASEAPLIETELLVEDVSIDGMCGVY